MLVCLLPPVAQATNPEFIFGQNYQAINPADLRVTGEDATPTHSATGAFTHDIPLSVPPGRSGVQPELLLQYNSQALDSDSWLSTGWSLSIPKITRLNKTGIDGMYDETNFTSSLSGELESVSLSDGQHGTYQTERDSGSFYQYEYNSDGSWIVVDKQGVAYTFGADTDSRVDNPDDASQIYAWYLTEKRDPNGNGVVYTYSKDQNQIYPDSISYTDHVDVVSTMSVDFTLTGRDDQLIEYGTGFEVATYYVIDTITMSVSGTWVWEYDFDYSKPDNRERTLLSNITETARATDGTETALPATTFTYADTAGGWTLDSSFSLPTQFTAEYSGVSRDYGTRLFDVNGDSLPDMIYAVDSYGSISDAVWLNTGSSWTQDTGYSVPVGFISQNTTQGGQDLGVRIADVNGDSLQDLIKACDCAGSDYTSDGVYLNDPDNKTWTLASYTYPIDFTSYAGGIPYDTGSRLVDINGDHLPDALYALESNSGVYEGTDVVYINNGSGWTQDTAYVIPIAFARQFYHSAAWDVGVAFDDVNGDGLTDIIQSTYEGDTGIYINQGLEKTWAIISSYGSIWSLLSSSGAAPYDSGVRLFDTNGDHLTDVLAAYTGSTGVYEDSYAVQLHVGDTTGWSEVGDADYPVPVGFVQQGTGNYVDEATRFADVDGDGLIDMVKSESGSSVTDNGVYLNDAEPADLLTNIDLGTGASITVDYVAADHAANPNLPYVVQTVSSLAKDDGLGNSVMTTYDYVGGEHYFESFERQRFAGFATITETTADRISTYSYDVSDWYRIGLIEQVVITDLAGVAVASTSTTWVDDDHFTYPTQRVSLLYNSDDSSVATTESYAYDTATGNVTSQTRWGEVTASADGSFTDSGDDDVTTTWIYAGDANDEIISVISRETLTDTNGTTVQDTLYSYDDLAFGFVETGNVTQREVWISGSDYATSSYTYDTYGKRLTQTDPLGNITSYTYDANAFYPQTITNALGHVQTFAYDLAVGKPTILEEANGTITETDYDGLGRPTAERKSSTADAATLETTQSWEYDDTSSPRSVTQRTYWLTSTYREVITYVDGFDRVVEVKTLNEDGTRYNELETTYDELDRVATSTLPEESASSAYDANTVASDLSESYTYDALSRVTTVANVLGNTTTSYEGFTKTVTDPLGNQKIYEADGLGRLVVVVEYLDDTANTTNYTWNAADYLTSITDAMGNVRNFTYDGRGLQLTAEDLHAASDTTYSTWIYTYDVVGNRETSLSPNGVTVTYGYDVLNRPTSEDASDTTGVEISSAYDSCTGGTGQLCLVAVNGETTTDYTYDAAGNKASETITIDGTAYTTSYTYDRQINLLTTMHPDSTVVTNTYNALGLLETVTDLIIGTDYGPHGQITSQTNSDSTLTTYTYDEAQRYRLTRKVTTDYEADGTTVTTTTTNTQTFYPTSGDGYIYQINASWDTAHDATSGAGVSYAGSNTVTGTSIISSDYRLFRTFIPFDTSSIPDDATVTDAKLNVYVYAKNNYDNDGDDFVTLVQTSQASTTALATADFGQAGSTNNPAEGIDTSERKDITSISTNAYLTFILNSTGRDWISKTDATKLGLREGHDVIDSAITRSSTTAYNYLLNYSSESSGTTYDPYLEVTYTQTITTEAEPVPGTVLQDLSYTYDAVGNITQIVDTSETDTAKTTDYNYDDLYRLTTATVTGAVDSNNETITYTYDAIGNITSRSDFGTYTYDGTDYANPHAVTSMLNPDGSTAMYSYDNSGNLTSDGVKSYRWDYKNRLISSGELTETTSTTTTTTSVYPTAGDGYISRYNASWDTAHDATSGTGQSATAAQVSVGTGRTTTAYYLYRVFLPFDTSSLPDDATITSATLHVYPYAKKNNDNDGDDFVTVVQTSQASTTTLSKADFDQAGSINNPTEGIDTSERKDITNVSTSAYLTFNLNSTGLGWVSPTGTTMLGLREGHDVIDSAFTSSSATSTQYNYLYARSSEYAGTTYDPYLSVIYTQPITTTTTTNEVTYSYDHGMRRISKSSDDATTYYPSMDYSVTDGVSTIYVSGLTSLVASIENNGTDATTHTIHTDHLGSTSVVTDEDGVMVELLDYNPYGTERSSWGSGDSGVAASQKTYIGEYSDSETNLSYLNARYYDPTIGRFLSQDPWFGDLTNPQSLNKYSYTENNPVKFTDSSGLFRQDTFNSGVDKIRGGIASLGWSVIGMSMSGTYGLGPVNLVGGVYDISQGFTETALAVFNAEPRSIEYTFADFKSDVIDSGIEVGSDFVEFVQENPGAGQEWANDQIEQAQETIDSKMPGGWTPFDTTDNSPPVSTTQPNYSTNNQYTCPDTSQTSANTTSSNWQNSLTNFVKENKN